MISSAGTVSVTGWNCAGLSIAVARRSSARPPMSEMRTRTVVSAGTTKRAVGMSSKPASAMSCGTRSPASVSAHRQPIAIMSFAAKTASGRIAGREQLAAGAIARLFGEIAAQDVFGGAGQLAIERGAIAAQALLRIDVHVRARDVRDRAMTAAGEVRDHRVGAAVVVDVERRVRVIDVDGADQHDRQRAAHALLQEAAVRRRATSRAGRRRGR